MSYFLPLRPGDTIGVCAPSSFVEPSDLAPGIAALEARGFSVRVHPQTFARLNQSAGTHAEKLSALHDLFADPSVRAIWAAGGGNRALHLLPHLDWALIAANPKPFVGFSDATAILNALAARANIPALHGPVLKRVREGAELDHLLALLGGQSADLPMEAAKILKPGRAAGSFVGGNLSLVQCLAGTRDMPACAGSILFLEEVGEEISRVDRAFAHLARLGVFGEISALILGNFGDLKDTGRPFGFTMEDIVAEHLEGYDIPVVLNAPFGHQGPFYALPVGGRGNLEADESTCRLNCALRER